MECKKSRKANLEKSRGLFFEIGLIITLAITLIAFEWTGSGKTDINYETSENLTLDEEIEPITRLQDIVKLPPPPKPEIAEVLNIVEDEIEIEDEFFMGDVEADQETEIEIRPFTEIPTEEEAFEEEVFFIVEKMPRFNGKEQEEFRKFIHEHIQYPEIAAENGIEGIVYVQFTVNRKGDISDVHIVRGVDPALDEEAIRVVSSSPKWTPGEQRGKPVSVCFTFPIHFQLNT